MAEHGAHDINAPVPKPETFLGLTPGASGAVMGTIVFWGICIVGLLITLPLKMKKDSKGVTQVSVVVGTFCFWLFWLATYCSQINPTLLPVMGAE
mmetsp:Transcript_3361/g.6580  ORF Transcript_3361/g.6580 Transcript_3361/m.6580 type:complete len:95 (+) Transcript_3361:71-355(+)|eukprot:CAMPEP_0113902084 /NCGR_PEP_ID=MMETSP0780_2-20120614/21637_1 /TAXON_ID=652834 /ORGANISM="Palpitomonas bilix" /LENGTH=94 /DNA_ID=CAMNT_0000894817 /DNA_START=19 /DNA_END=303 /DNA_ORIENTATION=+ /assembly_acc=CAM_ASM_000599